MKEIKYNVLTFSERNALSDAYNKWLDEENEIHKGVYRLNDNALQVITFLCGRGLLNAEKVSAFVREEKECKKL